jgi:hypothetical protein
MRRANFRHDASAVRSEFDDEGRDMTGLVVERLRTAFRLPSVPVAGVSTLMPPHIQGAERRMERRVRRTRWGLRALVLGGLAGAAWLLTGAAAQAAGQTDGPAGSLFGLVAGDGSSVSGLRSVADQPLESDFPVLEVPQRVRTRPAETFRDHARNPIDPALGPVDHVRGELAGPTRLTGIPVGSGSATPEEGGAPAFLPAAIEDSTMASHLLPIASDVEVRRYDAEAPTVSPD